MVQTAWAAIGLPAVWVLGMFGAFFYLGAKIDALRARLDGRIDGPAARVDALGARLDARIDGLEARIDALAARMDAFGGRLQAHIERHPG